jgi:hypothetical protein
MYTLRFNSDAGHAELPLTIVCLSLGGLRLLNNQHTLSCAVPTKKAPAAAVLRAQPPTKDTPETVQRHYNSVLGMY